MAKSAALKKPDNRKVPAKAKKPMKKPALKMVKNAKKAPKSKTPVKSKAKKPAVKLVKKAKPVAKKIMAKAPVKPMAKPAMKAPSKPLFKKPVTSVLPPVQVNKVRPAMKVVAKPESTKPLVFKVGDHVVYPTHGVGKIVEEETQVIGGVSLNMFVIGFDRDRMTLRVPVQRAASAGLRHVVGSTHMDKVFEVLKGRARTSRGMWSRRAQEYESKINSGSVMSVAEVVRDLHHNVDQSERSYSERMIYESAFNRLVGELSACEKSNPETATDKLLKILRGRKAA